MGYGEAGDVDFDGPSGGEAAVAELGEQHEQPSVPGEPGGGVVGAGPGQGLSEGGPGAGEAQPGAGDDLAEAFGRCEVVAVDAQPGQAGIPGGDTGKQAWR